MTTPFGPIDTRNSPAYRRSLRLEERVAINPHRWQSAVEVRPNPESGTFVVRLTIGDDLLERVTTPSHEARTSKRQVLVVAGVERYGRVAFLRVGSSPDSPHESVRRRSNSRTTWTRSAAPGCRRLVAVDGTALTDRRPDWRRLGLEAP